MITKRKFLNKAKKLNLYDELFEYKRDDFGNCFYTVKEITYELTGIEFYRISIGMSSEENWSEVRGSLPGTDMQVVLDTGMSIEDKFEDEDDESFDDLINLINEMLEKQNEINRLYAKKTS